MNMSTNPYKLMVAESRKHKLPRSFTTDLTVHDQVSVAANQGPMVWVLYECGTHLMRPGKHGRWATGSIVSGVKQTIAEMGDSHWYWWDGLTLREIRPEQAAGLLDGVEA